MSETADQIQRLEKHLRETLNEERAPVMGPCLESIRCRNPTLLEDGILETIRRILGRGEDSVASLVSCLQQWPAIAVLLITEQVNQAYGAGGEYAVHRAVEELIGMQKELSGPQRKKIWKGFRRAIYRIGLKVSSRESGVGYMVEEFLHQAGLPLSFVERVTTLMIRTANEVGLPEEDDPQGLARWQGCLLRNAKFLPPTARRSLEADETGFYVLTFLRAYGEQSGERSEKTAEGIMARVLADSTFQAKSRKSYRMLRIPGLMWRNDELVLELPAGDDRTWTINVDGEESTYGGEVGTEVVPRLPTLPRVVSISDGTFANECVIWDDEADNRFQIFNADGRWVQASSLERAEVRLSPGDYTLLLRFEPGDFEGRCQCAALDPDLFVLPITLLPGDGFSLRRGPAITVLRAEPRPWMRFSGVRLTPSGGEPIFYGKELRLDLALGEREDESLTLPDGRITLARTYTVRLAAGGSELARIPVQDTGIGLGEISKKLRPGLHRLIAELCPSGTERAIARSSVLLWTGLELQDSDGILHCSAWPENLIASGCENSNLRQEALTIGPRDSLSPMFRTEFTARNGRAIILDWSVPGVFVEVEDHGVSPVLRRRLEMGSMLALPPQSRQLLRIRSTEEGELVLDGQTIRELKSGRAVSLHLSSLAERLKTGCGALQFEMSSGRVCNVARLVAPHQIFGFLPSCSPRQYQIEFRFALPCSQVKCHVENLLTGSSLKLSAACDDPRGWADSNMIRLESRESIGGAHGYLLTVELCNFAAGPWFSTFEVCLDGRWGAPTNTRQDSYCFGLIVQRGGTLSLDLEAVLKSCDEPEDTSTLLESLNRVHRALQHCFAPECWDGLKWLKPLWKRWLSKVTPLDRLKVAHLVSLCEVKPPDSAGYSWLPLQRVEAATVELFAQPPHLYSGLKHPSTGLGHCLSAISRAGTATVSLPCRTG